jgi:hypothetical protein
LGNTRGSPGGRELPRERTGRVREGRELLRNGPRGPKRKKGKPREVKALVFDSINLPRITSRHGLNGTNLRG